MAKVFFFPLPFDGRALGTNAARLLIRMISVKKVRRRDAVMGGPWPCINQPQLVGYKEYKSKRNKIYI